jgi:hypothetical protein
MTKVMLEETRCPNIYAFYFVLMHGEEERHEGFRVTEASFEELETLDAMLGGFKFSDIVEYCDTELYVEPENDVQRQLENIKDRIAKHIPEFTDAALDGEFVS